MASLWRIMVGNTWFHLLITFSVLLITASWFVPPMAVIDSSVLAAVGELAGFSAIGVVIKALDKGAKASVRHNSTEVSVEGAKEGAGHDS